MAMTFLENVKQNSGKLISRMNQIGSRVSHRYMNSVNTSYPKLKPYLYMLTGMILIPLLLPDVFGVIYLFSWIGLNALSPLLNAFFDGGQYHPKVNLPGMTIENGRPRIYFSEHTFSNNASVLISTVSAYTMLAFEPLNIGLHYMLNAFALPVYAFKAYKETKHTAGNQPFQQQPITSTTHQINNPASPQNSTKSADASTLEDKEKEALRKKRMDYYDTKKTAALQPISHTESTIVVNDRNSFSL